jgi:hypothetical protein
MSWDTLKSFAGKAAELAQAEAKKQATKTALDYISDPANHAVAVDAFITLPGDSSHKLAVASAVKNIATEAEAKLMMQQTAGARSQSDKFCSCVKKVKKNIKPRRGTKEGAAIAICSTTILRPRGRTHKKVSCRKGRVTTQKRRT